MEWLDNGSGPWEPTQQTRTARVLYRELVKTPFARIPGLDRYIPGDFIKDLSQFLWPWYFPCAQQLGRERIDGEACVAGSSSWPVPPTRSETVLQSRSRAPQSFQRASDFMVLQST